MDAASVVSVVVGKLGIVLIQKTGNALIQEIILLNRVRQQFERLRRELVSIIGFLKTADSKHSNNQDILVWVSDVRDIAYDIDDVIDVFFLKCVSKKEGSNVFQRAARWPRKIFHTHRIGMEIEKIFRRLDDITRRRKSYKTPSAYTANNKVCLRRSFAHVTEDVIGLEKEIRTLVGQLVEKEERRRVITIWGMGGLGKTTLARKVYQHSDVRSSFDCQAWTFVSQEFILNDVLQNVLRQVSTFSNEEVERMKEEELVEKLSAALKEKRYLVVLDDIWHVGDWVRLKAAFPTGKSGSKVMLTTRIREIGLHADPWALPVEPRLLTADEAWNLMFKKVFPVDIVGTGRSVSSNFEKCGREMALKCGGLPLAVDLLAGILASKTTLKEWETVSKMGQGGIMAELALSYTDLPYRFKPFFLYLGLFPKDHHISVKQLIRMWIAESMISEVQGDSITMEDVGRHHLDELIQRCMVQVTKRDSQRRASKCQLHDNMRDLVIVKGGEENFFEIVERPPASSNYLAMAGGGRKLRRCVINVEEDNRHVFPQHLRPQLRTVFFVGIWASSLNIAYQDFKLVKVLQFQGIQLSEERFRKIIGKLKNLRYLGLKDTRLRRLPESIGNLVSLETLDLRNSGVQSLPNVIWKMRQLRHLYLPEACMDSSSLRMDTLTKLQTLSRIAAGPWIAYLVKLRNLNKLAIKDLAELQVAVINIYIDGWDNLVSLSLEMKGCDEISNLKQLSQKKNLLSLKLNGTMQNIPSSLPPNTTKLKLWASQLTQDPMPTLQMLQNLAHLHLFNAYRGKEMVCSKNGFPQLRYLELSCLEDLEEWRVEKGAMPCLTTCEIYKCDSLKMVPRGFQFVTTLQKLSITESPRRTKKLKERVKEGGEDWDNVRNIPLVTVMVK